MSIKLLNLALDAQLPPTLKLVLAAFADTTDETGKCWPSMQFIARRSSVSKRTAQRATQELINAGYIECLPRFRPDRSQGSNLYKLHIPPLPQGDTLTSPPVSDVVAGMKTVTVGGDTVVTLTTNESSNESINHHNDPELIFPGRFSEIEQSTAAKMLAVFSHEIAQQLLDEVAARIRRNDIKKAPISYLRALVARAKQGEFLPEIGESEVQIRAQKLTKHLKPQSKITAPSEARNHLNELKKLIK